MPSATRLVQAVVGPALVVTVLALGVKAAVTMSTARVVSPSVVASWWANDDTTLLVLWRGAPGWFSKGGAGGGTAAGGAQWTDVDRIRSIPFRTAA